MVFNAFPWSAWNCFSAKNAPFLRLTFEEAQCLSLSFPLPWSFSLDSSLSLSLLFTSLSLLLCFVTYILAMRYLMANTKEVFTWSDIEKKDVSKLSSRGEGSCNFAANALRVSLFSHKTYKKNSFLFCAWSQSRWNSQLRLKRIKAPWLLSSGQFPVWSFMARISRIIVIFMVLLFWR